MAPGDVLVLVRRRNAFQRLLTRALKVRGVPVAGLDRMVLTDQPAVSDLLSLCDTLLLPQDDLALACVLTSPLGGLTDGSLLALAADRAGSLWDVLRQRNEEDPGWGRAYRFITTLMARADHVSPYLLLSEALGPLGARHRLYSRLGVEAAEPIDELLNIAQSYAKTHSPSLQSFVHWLRQSGSEVKREAESAGGAVRIMTVHGAKGLQAPLVILPDTTSTPPEDNTIHWVDDEITGQSLPVWSGRQDLRCAVAGDLRDAARGRQMEEQNRLLYVALTRAEDRLLVCGWQNGRKMPELAWYGQVRGAFERLGATASPFQIDQTPWEGETLHVETAQTAPPAPALRKDEREPVVLPKWAGQAPDWVPTDVPTEPSRPQPLAPSRPDGIQWGDAPSGVSPLADIAPAQRGRAAARFRLGDLTHSLLQHLPSIPDGQRASAIERFLNNPFYDLDAAAAQRLRSEVLAVLGHPALEGLFGRSGRSEVPIAGVVGNAAISGVIDRLVVLPDRIIVADYKTNRVRPRSVDTVQAAYLRQMSAYREMLREIFPGRVVLCVLIWTIDAAVMELPDQALDAHRPNAPSALDRLL
jgi:ATP-dependent helicase/nuclease subunit A